ncbi:hypothetical protein ACHAWF_015606 [Thalassiosira exigua]
MATSPRLGVAAMAWSWCAVLIRPGPCAVAFQPSMVLRGRVGVGASVGGGSSGRAGRRPLLPSAAANAVGQRRRGANDLGRLAMAPQLTEEGLNGGATAEEQDAEAEYVEGLSADAPSISDKGRSSASASTGGITAASSSRQLPTNWLGEKTYILFTAVLIGLFTGTNIAVFKTAVEFVREALYGDGIRLPLLSPVLWNSGGEEIMTFSVRLSEVLPLSIIPLIGGLVVGGLLKFGGDMPPGLRDTVKEVDLDSIRASDATPPEDLLSCTKDLPPPSERNDLMRFFRKSLAATATLGTGNSLGPEGPSVEAGMSFSRLLMNNDLFSKLTWVFGTLEDYDLTEVERVNRKVARDRLFLSCGAAAGVSAGFNAPLSGVFFALEIVQNALVSIDFPLRKDENGNGSSREGETRAASVGGEALALQQINISAILLASVVSALTIQLLLGSELALRLGAFDFNNPLLELPLYLVLGAMSGLVAAIFSGVAQFSKNVFDGEEGPEIVQQTFKSIPKYAKPMIASVLTGVVGYFIPQVLFFGKWQHLGAKV